jgi:hypothetical protein
VRSYKEEGNLNTPLELAIATRPNLGAVTATENLT